MKFDYFCFSLPKLGENDYVIMPNDDENTRWVKVAERKLFKRSQEEGLCIVYDRSSHQFYKDGKLFDVKGKAIFPRSFISTAKELLKALEENGAKPIMTLKEREVIEKWPLYVEPYFRDALLTTYKDFKDNCGEYSYTFVKPFLKTAKKSNKHYFLSYYGKVDFGGQKIFFTKPPIFDLKDDEEIIVSQQFEGIDDCENDMDCREYRAFVVENELLNLSRSYIDYVTEVPKDVEDFTLQLMADIKKKGNFPRSYVVDIAEMIIDGRRVIDLIEFNSIAESGLEVNNDLVEDYLNIRRKDDEGYQTSEPFKD